jgi:hypothetical protein
MFPFSFRALNYMRYSNMTWMFESIDLHAFICNLSSSSSSFSSYPSTTTFQDPTTPIGHGIFGASGWPI